MPLTTLLIGLTLVGEQTIVLGERNCLLTACKQDFLSFHVCSMVLGNTYFHLIGDWVG